MAFRYSHKFYLRFEVSDINKVLLRPLMRCDILRDIEPQLTISLILVNDLFIKLISKSRKEP